MDADVIGVGDGPGCRPCVCSCWGAYDGRKGTARQTREYVGKGLDWTRVWMRLAALACSSLLCRQETRARLSEICM